MQVQGVFGGKLCQTKVNISLFIGLSTTTFVHYVTSMRLHTITQKSLKFPKEKRLKSILVDEANTVVAFIMDTPNDFCFKCMIICLLMLLGESFGA